MTEVPKCNQYHQADVEIRVSRRTYNELKRILRASVYDRGPNGFVGGNHLRFNGIIISDDN